MVHTLLKTGDIFQEPKTGHHYLIKSRQTGKNGAYKGVEILELQPLVSQQNERGNVVLHQPIYVTVEEALYFLGFRDSLPVYDTEEKKKLLA